MLAKLRILTVLLCAAISSCSVGPSYNLDSLNISQEISSAYIPNETKRIMLLAEQEQNVETKNNYYIYAINSLMSKKQLPKVTELWQKIEKDSLNEHQKIAVDILSAKYLLLQNNKSGAVKKLQNLTSKDLSEKESQVIYGLLSTIYKDNRNLVSFIKYHQKSRSSYNSSKELLSSLVKYSPSTLQSNIKATSDENIKGWLELAILAQTNSNQEDIVKWQQSNTEHPANALISQNSYKTNNIAILLPLKGELAKTSQNILQGFLIEHYKKNSHNNITVIDTSNSSFNEELKKLTQISTPDIVIGPITKNEVDNIDSSLATKSLIIALNSSEKVTANNIVHFSLTPKDETNKIADDVFHKGFNHALVFTSEEPWQQKISEQFTKAWESLEGKATVHYINNTTPLSSQLKKSLSIDESERRAKELESIISTKLKFIPSRRADIDMIFLATSPRQARQIKPLLKYYFAGDIPVYSTSTIFNPAASSYEDVDLNDIRFCDSNWIVNTFRKDPMQKTLKKLWPKDFETNKRLFAMGGDVAKIVASLNTLSSIDGSIIKGYTGTLSFEDGNILRGLEWFKFYKGAPRITANY